MPDAREIAARTGETGDQPGRDRVAAHKHDRDRRGGVFRRLCRRDAALSYDQVYSAVDEFGGQPWQPIVAALRPAIFDRHVFSLEISGVAQTLAEGSYNRSGRPG